MATGEVLQDKIHCSLCKELHFPWLQHTLSVIVLSYNDYTAFNISISIIVISLQHRETSILVSLSCICLGSDYNKIFKFANLSSLRNSQ